MQMQISCVLILLAGSAGAIFAQERATSAPVRTADTQQVMPVSGRLDAGSAAVSNYILGPDDEITLFVSDVDEISNKPMRIDMRGDINLPMAGRVHAAGMTADRLETEIEGRLKKFLKDPEVVVSVKEFRSQPISVLGDVDKPGVHQLEGRKTSV